MKRDQRAPNDIDIVAFDLDEAVDVDVSPRTLFVASIKVGLVGLLKANSPLFRSITTTWDIVGLMDTACKEVLF